MNVNEFTLMFNVDSNKYNKLYGISRQYIILTH